MGTKMSDEEPEPMLENNPKKQDEQNSSDLILRATQAAERLEAGNKELSRLIAIQQKIQIENTLSGKAVAGHVSQTDEEKSIASAKKLLEGTGLEDYAFPEEKK